MMASPLARTIARALVAGLGGVDRVLPPGQPAHPALAQLRAALVGDDLAFRMALVLLLSPGPIGAYDLPGFAWKPGMRAIRASGVLVAPVRVISLAKRVAHVYVEHDGSVRTLALARLAVYHVPDLTDDATGGVLLAMVPDTYHLHIFDGVWTLHDTDGNDVGSGPTLGEACAALMVARGRCG